MKDTLLMNMQESKERWISIAVFALCCSWILALPFKGSILFALTEFKLVASADYIFNAFASHLLGLLIAGYVVKSTCIAKKTMTVAIAVNVALFFVFFTQPSVIWLLSLYAGAFLSGLSLASWGFFYKSLSPQSMRLKTAADALFFSSLLSLFINLIAQKFSPQLSIVALGLCQLIGLGFVLLLPVKHVTESDSEGDEVLQKGIETKRIIFLTLFILVVTLNSGLLHQVVNPAFLELSHMLKWYQAIPYLVTLVILRNIPRTLVRSFSIPITLAISCFAFIAFSLFNESPGGVFIVEALMFTINAIINLFVWGVLNEMMVIFKPPSRTMGIGLGANAIGVMFGWFLAQHFLAPHIDDSVGMLFTLAITSVTLLLLPFFTQQISELKDEQEVQKIAAEISRRNPEKNVNDSMIEEMLSARENEIAQLLFTGITINSIAQELFVSENTVKTHVKSIYSKTGVKNRVELMNLFLNDTIL